MPALIMAGLLYTSLLVAMPLSGYAAFGGKAVIGVGTNCGNATERV